ncbi:hypothetical protein IAU60_001752 [Kwoniella sp. DSM 27419]
MATAMLANGGEDPFAGPRNPYAFPSSGVLTDEPLSLYSTDSECITSSGTQSERPYSSAPFTAYRVSRLPPAPTVYSAGPSRNPQRYLYFAVRRGHNAGVYTEWHQAEKQIIDFPRPVFKTFSTRLAAEAFVAGWDGAGRHSLPTSSPFPLREHLAMSFPGSVPMPSPSSSRRQSYHARLLSATSSPSGPDSDFSPANGKSGRPGMDHRSSYRNSMVRVSSPLRQQVDDDDSDRSDSGSIKSRQLPPIRKAASLIGVGGLLSPPQSPDCLGKKERPVLPRSWTENGNSPWPSKTPRDAASSMGRNPQPSLPLSPPQSPADRRASLQGSPSVSRRPSGGLWADAVPTGQPQQSCLLSPNAPTEDGLGLSELSAPKFSRSALKKSGVVMPVAAKRQSLSTSLRSRGSMSSLLSPSASSSSSSVNSYSWSHPKRSASQAQDRLASLAETSKRELQLNEDGLLALGALSPPRPAFLVRRSSSASSLASNDSFSSMGSLTSGTSAQTSSLDSCEPIAEEVDGACAEVQVLGSGVRDTEFISCTRSDADADGSVGDRDSVKRGKTGKKGKGGMFSRLAKVLKLEKRPAPGHENGRRGSL